MPSIAADCAIARNAEAARFYQARFNRSGLECSSYAWQVGRPFNGSRISSCQEDSGLTSLFYGRRDKAKSSLSDGSSARRLVLACSPTREGDSDKMIDFELLLLGFSATAELAGTTDTLEKPAQVLFEQDLEALLGFSFLAGLQ